ncbi:MAG: phosphate acyltransferase PlsX [Acidimicrobiia bacterium]
MSLIAVDAMGGDHAPGEIVCGAVDAAKDGHDVVLVGDEPQVRTILDEVGFDLDVVHATEVIRMDEDPAAAIRERKDASISVAARLVANGDAAGVVSAGSTGAVLAAAAFLIGRLPGVARPSLATLFPGSKVVLDSGANLACRSEHLVQFGVMGAALAETLLGIPEPRVGLVNIGEEEGKGRDLEKSAFDGLRAVEGIRFVGNVEGRDLATDAVDVLVTDGFTGNVLLKTAEGTAHLVREMFEEAIARSPLAAGDTMAASVAGLRRRVDPEATGGAHLLGTKGVVVVAHGSSSRLAVANAIAMADEGASRGLVERIATGLAAGDD